MFHRLTESSRRTLFLARDQAPASHQSLIEPDHLLLGLIRLHPELFDEHLHLAILSVLEVKSAGSKQSATSSKAANLRFSDELKRVLRNANDEAASLYRRKTARRRRLLEFLTMNRWIVEPCHLLLGLLRESDCTAAKSLIELGVTLQTSRERFSQSTCGTLDSL